MQLPPPPLSPPSQIAQLWAPVDTLSFNFVESSASQQQHQAQFHHNDVVCNPATTIANTTAVVLPNIRSNIIALECNTDHTMICNAYKHSPASVASTTSAGEPSPLSIGFDEQSFIYTTSTADGCIDYRQLPIQLSQDYTDGCSIFDEVQQIVNQSEFKPTSNTNNTSITSVGDEAFAFTFNEASLFNDSAVQQHSMTMLDEADNTFGDVMMGAGKLFKFDSQSSVEVSSLPQCDYANLLTPAASPQSTHRSTPQLQSVGDIRDEDENSWNTAMKFQLTDHTYNVVKSVSQQHQGENRAQCKRKLQLDEPETKVVWEQTSHQLETIDLQTKTNEDLERIVKVEATQQHPQPAMRHRRRVAPLRLKLPLRQTVSCTAVLVDTPEITNCILDLEESRDFDLIRFINSSQVRQLVFDIVGRWRMFGVCMLAYSTSSDSAGNSLKKSALLFYHSGATSIR